MSECDLRRFNEAVSVDFRFFASRAAGGLVGAARREILNVRGELGDRARRGQRPQVCFGQECRRFASFNECEDAGKVKEPDALNSPRLPNGNGADETFGRPFIEFCPRAAGEKFVPIFGRSDPHWQIAVALDGQLRGAGILPALPIHKLLFHKSPFLQVISTYLARKRNL